MKLSRVTNGASVDSTEVLLYGEIGWDVEAKAFVEQLQAVDSQKITLRVNSPGGDVYDGLAIMNALRVFDGDVTAVVEGMAASAASFIVVGGADRVIMRPDAEMMIHDALTMTAGNAEELQRQVADLERISGKLAGIYAGKAGGDPETWRAAMRDETWFTADEAVACGLADAVEDGRAPAMVASWERSRVVAHYRGRRGDPPEKLFRNLKKEENPVNLIENLASELGVDAGVLREHLGALTNEAMKVTAEIDVTFPEKVEVQPTGAVEIAPNGDLPAGVEVTVGDLPDGWSADVAESGVITVHAPAADPDTEITVPVTVASGEEALDFEVVVVVVTAEKEEPEAPAETPAPAEGGPAPTITLDRGTYEDLVSAAEKGWEAKRAADDARLVAEVDTWISEGRINAARREQYIDHMRKDPTGARALYGAIPKNTIPMRETGHGVAPDVEAEISKGNSVEDLDRLALSRAGKKN